MATGSCSGAPLPSFFRVVVRQVDAAADPAEPLRGTVIVSRLKPGRIVKGPDMHRDLVRVRVIGKGKRRAARLAEASAGDRRGAAIGRFRGQP